MKSAIVMKPGKTEKEENWVFVVVNLPTIDVAISYSRQKLAGLNIFQKGVAYFLLAGVYRVDAIARVMGVTDEDFVSIILSELVKLGYARKISESEFVPTSKLESDFSGSISNEESGPHQMIVFVPSGNGATKIAGPMAVHVATSEVFSSADSTRVSVGNEGKPLQVDCIVSDFELPIQNKVDRSKAKSWVIGESFGRKEARTDELATRVEILATKSRPFVLQCRLKDDAKSRPIPSRPHQLRSAIVVKFAGEKDAKSQLATRLAEIAENDSDFFTSLQKNLQGLEQNQAREHVIGRGASQMSDDSDEAKELLPPPGSTPNQQQTQQRTRKKRPLEWIVEILNARLFQLGTNSFEGMLAADNSIERQISIRLVEFGSQNRKPAVPPLPLIQLEAIAADQLHNELEICVLLGAWVLLEDAAVVDDMKQLNLNFINGLCAMFVNPHVEVDRDMRETFKYLGSIRK